MSINCLKKANKPTKIHQFDPPMRRQQDVVALDITVDGLVDVKVLEALRGSKREEELLSHDSSDVGLRCVRVDLTAPTASGTGLTISASCRM